MVLNSMLKIQIAFRAAFLRTFDWQTIVTWFACSMLATYSGPFGTYQNYSLFELLFTWMVLLGTATFTAFLLHEICKIVVPTANYFIFHFVFFAVTSFSIGLLIHVLLTRVLGHESIDKPSQSELTFYAFAAMCFILTIRDVVLIKKTEPTQTESPRQPETAPASIPSHSRLAKRLDIPHAARIIQVTAKGHFVEVQTCTDTYSTRMRFLDAVDELDGTCGLTVHRSHWVHLDAIRGWVPDAKKPYLLLENEKQIPISKTNVEKVENAGLLAITPDVGSSV